MAVYHLLRRVHHHRAPLIIAIHAALRDYDATFRRRLAFLLCEQLVGGPALSHRCILSRSTRRPMRKFFLSWLKRRRREPASGKRRRALAMEFFASLIMNKLPLEKYRRRSRLFLTTSEKSSSAVCRGLASCGWSSLSSTFGVAA